jgi:hypothetical protein
VVTNIDDEISKHPSTSIIFQAQTSLGKGGDNLFFKVTSNHFIFFVQRDDRQSLGTEKTFKFDLQTKHDITSRNRGATYF